MRDRESIETTTQSSVSGAAGISMKCITWAGQSIRWMMAGCMLYALCGAAQATDVRLFGFVGYTYQGSTAELKSDGVRNLSTKSASNLLRLELWAFPSPYTAGMSGYQIATDALDAVDTNSATGPIDSGFVPFAPPPDGIWYFTMMLTEYAGAGTTVNDGYVIRYSINFTAPEYIGIPQPPTVIAAIEFYNAGLDHYFIATNPKEISDLDTGVHPGWARTGQGFGVWNAAGTASSPVCRFYIPPGYGDSHFFSASPTECGQTSDKFPWLIEESVEVFYVGLPDATSGACASNEVPVFRLWNGRADSNHRYTTSPAIKATMITQGYIAEGYGPDQVAMCSPE
jgi:hypothetical protein